MTRCWNKKWPNCFSKSCPEESKDVFSLQSDVFIVVTKMLLNFWATFVRKFVAQTVQNNPIWSFWEREREKSRMKERIKNRNRKR